jgi:hypothetical protein
MKRKPQLGCLLALAAMLSACASTPGPASLAHDVYIKLKEPSNAAVQELTRDCRELERVPGVMRIAAGRRATTIKRSYNDEAFDVGLHVVFDNDDAFESYLVHPLHKALLEKWGAKIASIRVFDFRPGQ